MTMYDELHCYESIWNTYDYNKASLAVIVVDEYGCGTVLWPMGGYFKEMKEGGYCTLNELSLNLPSTGIWIWEGKFDVEEYGADPIPVGEFRVPTDEEWISIKRNESPWNDEDWKMKDK